MRILVATTGSDGDVQPFFALARALTAAGHDVRVAASDHYEARATRLGIAFTHVGPPWDDEAVRRAFTAILAEEEPFAQLAIVIDSIADDQRAAVPELVALSKEADVVVYPPLFVAAAAAARAAKVKHVSVHFAPMHRARGYGPTGANWGGLINALGWRMAGSMIRRTTDHRLAPVVEAAGLPPWRDVLLDASHSRLLDLVAVSPAVLQKDPAWGAETRVTGYWFLDEPGPADGSELELHTRGRPVVIGFGSMAGLDPERTTSTLLDAVRDLAHPVVLQSGWAGLGARSLPAHVHVAGFVPHTWLFARAACVVHHGGAGTTAAAFRAGVPQTIVWHLGDQPVWARHAIRLGVSRATRSHRHLDARWLRAELDRMLSDEAMKARAREVGEAVRSDDGLGNAVRAIEEVGALG